MIDDEFGVFVGDAKARVQQRECLCALMLVETFFKLQLQAAVCHVCVFYREKINTMDMSESKSNLIEFLHRLNPKKFLITANSVLAIHPPRRPKL